jgi:hypothetical protein
MKKSGELPSVNQSAHTRAQSSIPSNLTKQQSQKGKRRMDPSDSAISQSHSEFQAESPIHCRYQHRNGQLTSQQFQSCQKAIDTIRTDPDWRLQLIDFFQTLKGQEDTPIGRQT